MRVGISVTSSLPSQGAAQAMVERSRAAYAAGLSSLSVGDHHAVRGSYMQNTPTLGRLLAEWPDRPAGCLFLLPLWSPVLVAEQVGTLAAMVDAPFIVQVGIGSGRAQFAAMGADLSTRGRVTDESIRAVQGLLAGETVEGVSIGLRPTQEVEWWIGGHADATLQRAAHLGTAWYGGPDLSLAESQRLIAGYREACAAAGTEPRAIARRDVLVLADGDRARREAATLVEQGYRGMTLDPLIVGGRDDAAEDLAALAEVGYDDVIIRCMSADQAIALETIEEVAGSLAG